ncbi:head scaffolding protein [Gordonia phage Hedwig]|uniref:Scaffolding protein n=1 Tax=Gordonia phage Hedwig TaxID=1887648 RepID=A0A1C9EHP2_9CAUD|nr:head scaffolding protein [Gordonia phage Hedwig]AON97299.1 scaffolding protein [Gordonia phage Hedwig]QDH92449.1 scaffolding protein [Gordonia phage Dmitri]
MGDAAVLHKPGEAVTLTAGADITGGQLVYLSGDLVVSPTTGALSTVRGVAAHDAKSGEKVTVLSGVVVELAADGAIAAGALVVSAAAGAAATIASNTFDKLVGIAESAAASSKVRVKLFR